jgi:acyl carrier protein
MFSVRSFRFFATQLRTRQDVEEIIYKFINIQVPSYPSTYDTTEFSANAKFSDIGLDPFDVVGLVVWIERELGVAVKDSYSTVDQLVTAILEAKEVDPKEEDVKLIKG